MPSNHPTINGARAAGVPDCGKLVENLTRLGQSWLYRVRGEPVREESRIRHRYPSSAEGE